MDVQEYLRQVTPFSVLQILEAEALDGYLNGYSYALNSGITIIYPETDPPDPRLLGRRNARNHEAPATFPPLCRNWRGRDGIDQDGLCLAADDRRAWRYFTGDLKKHQLYRCEPLALWDMTFPLIIADRVVGVLFGGQIIVESEDDAAVDWRKELKAYEDIVDWDTCPPRDNHIQAVARRITDADLTADQQQPLLEALHPVPISPRRNLNLVELETRLKDFLHFGNMLQGLLSQIHQARVTAAQEQLLRSFDERLSSLDLWDSAKWWEACADSVSALTDLPGVLNAALYVRDRSRYRRMPDLPHLNQAVVQARDVIGGLHNDIFTRLSADEHGDLLADLGLGQHHVWGYLHNTGSGREVSSSLLVLRGDPEQAGSSLLAKLCDNICDNANVAHLVFREREADKAFREQALLIGHSFRTPLQAIQIGVEEIRKRAIANIPDLRESTQRCTDRIKDAQVYLSLLLEPATQVEVDFDLAQVLNYVMQSMKPNASSRSVEIVRLREWREPVPVHGVKNRVQRALICLMDNAIKYSYRGVRQDLSRFEVRVSLGVGNDDGYAVARMSNYGVGIPPEKQRALREYGVRGEVTDNKYARLGTGLGLPFAIDVFEEHGGWIHVTSEPASSASERERESYHRYITTVEAVLPLRR